MQYSLLVSGIFLSLFCCWTITACTTFVVTPGASSDGTMYIGHTNDGYGPGLVGPYPDEEISNLISIPSASHIAGSDRRVFYDAKSGGDPDGNIDPFSSLPSGAIPQVSQTNGYLSSAYGIMNEYGLMCSEATDYSRIIPSFDPRNRILYASELSNIALERCKTPTEAIDLISYLIDTYGYYGYGETLIFANASEAWVLEMCGTPEQDGGIWAAEKVQDGEVFAGGNIFRIGFIDPARSDQKLSANAKTIAEQEGWWDPNDGPFHFSRAYSAGEFSHPYHTIGRIWSIYNRIAPDLNLSPVVSGWKEDPYPFSVIPIHPLNRNEVFSLFRDHYEGTVWDLTSGPAAGPFGDPYRERGEMDDYPEGADDRIVAGAWPYPVSDMTCGYSYVCESHPDIVPRMGGIVWFGFAQPYETCYVPLFPRITRLSPQFYEGNRTVFSHSWGYWPFSTVTNWARLRYQDIIPIIRKKQQEIEEREISDVNSLIRDLDNVYLASGDAGVREVLTRYAEKNAEEVFDMWWDLSGELIVRFSNGMVWVPVTKNETLYGYPDWWYNLTGYQYGPRVYRTDFLQEIPGLVYTNTTKPFPSTKNPKELFF